MCGLFGTVIFAVVDLQNYTKINDMN